MKFNAGEHPQLPMDGSVYSYTFGPLRKYAFQVLRDGRLYIKSKPETPLLPNWNHLFIGEENIGKWRKTSVIRPNVELQMGNKTYQLLCEPKRSKTKDVNYRISADGSSVSSLMIKHPQKLLDSSTQIDLTETTIESLSTMETVILRGLIYYIGFHFLPND